jgi:hypothetical protein
MASINDLKSSKFLKKEDVGQGALVTIRAISQENVAKEGAEPELRWTLHFEEFEKPMVLNSTNGQIIGNITGIENDIEIGWVGKQVVIFHDPNVSFGGKLIGGIRVRAVRRAQPKPAAQPVIPAQRPASALSQDEVDDLPF